ncbi:hypothetical protein B0H14DRAFT_3137515 [Mycena olivaceomarginata]|nr:hypothetical protein B0H14DRAFT_3137515 [Mycena olivaceomarginata]
MATALRVHIGDGTQKARARTLLNHTGERREKFRSRTFGAGTRVEEQTRSGERKREPKGEKVSSYDTLSGQCIWLEIGMQTPMVDNIRSILYNPVKSAKKEKGKDRALERMWLSFQWIHRWQRNIQKTSAVMHRPCSEDGRFGPTRKMENLTPDPLHTSLVLINTRRCLGIHRYRSRPLTDADRTRNKSSSTRNQTALPKGVVHKTGGWALVVTSLGRAEARVYAGWAIHVRRRVTRRPSFSAENGPTQFYNASTAVYGVRSALFHAIVVKTENLRNHLEGIKRL